MHFFGTRKDPADLIPRVQVGQLAEGTSAYPKVASLKQVHGTHVVIVDPSQNRGDTRLQDGDALVTNQPNVALIVRTADCVPILVANVKRRVIAAIHAGWRGTLAGVVSKTLSVLHDQFGSQPEELKVAIGPSIGPCCYEVDAPVIGPLQESVPYWADVMEVTGGKKAMLNLRKLVGRQFSTHGVLDSAISEADPCTRCRADLFYSYRREGTVNGTMMSGIMLNSTESVR